MTVTQGDQAGQPFQVLPWERRFIRGTFGQAGDSALSIARGNGKSGLLSGLAMAAVDGGVDGSKPSPLNGPRKDVVIVASSFGQAKIIFEDVQAFLREKYGDLPRKHWKIEDSSNKARIQHKDSGARVRKN